MSNAKYAETPTDAFVDNEKAIRDLRPGDILVFGDPGCSHCIGALLANSDPKNPGKPVIQTENGTRIIWISGFYLTDEQFKALGMVKKDKINPKTGKPEIDPKTGETYQAWTFPDGTQFTGTPAVTRIGENKKPGGIIARGEVQQPGAFETLSRGEKLIANPEVQLAWNNNGYDFLQALRAPLEVDLNGDQIIDAVDKQIVGKLASQQKFLDFSGDGKIDQSDIDALKAAMKQHGIALTDESNNGVIQTYLSLKPQSQQR